LKLRHLAVVDTDNVPEDVVFLGHTVKLLDLDDDSEQLVRLVGEAQPPSATDDVMPVSVNSPMGEALMKARVGETIKVNSLDGPYLDWTWVGDIAEGIERVWAAEALPHRLYVLSCGETYSIGDILRLWSELGLLPGLRYELVDETEANAVVAGGPPGPVPSNARLRADLGWAPSTPIRDGMRRYLDWIANHGPQ